MTRESDHELVDERLVDLGFERQRIIAAVAAGVRTVVSKMPSPLAS